MKTQIIGYWSGNGSENSKYPNVDDWVDPSWSKKERDAAIAHLKSGKTKTAYRGFSQCRICGCMNGSIDLTDGTYVFPEGLVHYVEKHNVRLPEEFMNHILGR